MAVMALLDLLVLLWVAVSVKSELDLQKRIIGGEKCDEDARLYHVKLTGSNKTHENSCGGSLISDRWILTAAHCWVRGWMMHAHVGVHPQSTSEETMEIVHDPVIFSDEHGSHDIMLVKLPRAATIQPIEIPDCKTALQVGATVQIAGYGATSAGPKNERMKQEPPSDLQCADIEVVNCSRLAEVLQKTGRDRRRARQHWFCGQTSKRDACPGDSGGAAVQRNKLYGVISFTGDPDFVCTEAVGLMDVCWYRKWIKHTSSKWKVKLPWL